MLEFLEGDVSRQACTVAHKIHVAGNAARLWHLRSDMMTVLALRHGEALAQQKVASLAPLFRDVLHQSI